jgi:nitrogenase molybdenum-cofactor synthesis protein NifE
MSNGQSQIGFPKEQPIAYKMGICLCDHNHERKIALAGFEGVRNFAKEIHATVMSLIWKFSPARIKAKFVRCFFTTEHAE